MRRPFGLVLIACVLLPSEIGYQDLGALLARQPGVAERWREHAVASPFGTIHAATFNLPRPVGTAMPPAPRVRLASLDLQSADVTGSLPRHDSEPPMIMPLPRPIDYPTVERRLKGDLLVPRSRIKSRSKPKETPPPPVKTVKTRKFVRHDEPLAGAVAGNRPERIGPGELTEEDRKLSPETVAAVELDRAAGSLDTLASDTSEVLATADPAVRTAKLYLGTSPSSAPGQKPQAGEGDPVAAKPAESASPEPKPNELTVAAKGEVTGPERRPMTPAERLGLTGKLRAKHERCLANAIYFESRGEPERGQMAVAQVVLNRVFSTYYPDNICDVVYQNAHRHLACQFTFACDGIPDIVTEPDAWKVATRIARDTLDGKIWLPEIGKSTHYHATYVRPSWVSEMKKMMRIGIHNFYRPLAWGDGSDEPKWGSGARVSQKPSIAEARM